MKKINMLGERSGRLTVIAESPNSKKGEGMWLCKCECGNEVIALGHALRIKRKQSCGCLLAESNVKRLKTHGMAGTRVYRSWQHMKERCDSIESKDYKNYGGRGIRYCEQWKSFESFYEWSMNNGYSDSLSIDRIDNDGNYEPSNCRWSTRQVQNSNTRVNIFVEINNQTKTLASWAKEVGMNEGTIRWRYKQGITGERLISKKDYRSNKDL